MDLQIQAVLDRNGTVSTLKLAYELKTTENQLKQDILKLKRFNYINLDFDPISFQPTYKQNRGTNPIFLFHDSLESFQFDQIFNKCVIRDETDLTFDTLALRPSNQTEYQKQMVALVGARPSAESQQQVPNAKDVYKTETQSSINAQGQIEQTKVEKFSGKQNAPPPVVAPKEKANVNKAKPQGIMGFLKPKQ